MNLKALILEALEDTERQKLIDSIVVHPPIKKGIDFLKFIQKKYSNENFTPEELEEIITKRRITQRKAAKKRLLQDPIKREKIYAKNRDYHNKSIQDPVKREKIKIRAKNANEKFRQSLKEDPVKQELRRAKNRIIKQNLLKDPIKREKIYAKNREIRKQVNADPIRKEKRISKRKTYFKNKMKSDPEFAIKRICRDRFCKFVKKNSDKYREVRRDRHNERMANEVEYGLRMSCRNRFSDFIRSKGGISFSKNVHMDYEKLKDHLERLFKPGMSWENRGKWHIDHIRPLASFKYINDDGSINQDEIAASWDINNLQPLWDHENMSKGRKWDSEGEEHFHLEPKDLSNDIPNI
jgi:hypothetical protein